MVFDQGIFLQYSSEHVPSMLQADTDVCISMIDSAASYYQIPIVHCIRILMTP